MFSKVPSVAIFSCVTLVLAGCTLLPIKKIQPLIAPPSASACPNETRVQLLVNGTNRFGYPLTKNIPQFGYLLPADNDPASGRGVTQRSSLKTFVDYDRAVGMRLRDKLDSDLLNDSVVKAFTAFVTSVSGEAQLDAQIAERPLQPVVVWMSKKNSLRYDNAWRAKTSASSTQGFCEQAI